MSRFVAYRGLGLLVVFLVMAGTAYTSADEPPYDPTSPEQVAEREQNEDDEGGPILSGPEVEAEKERGVLRMRGRPGAPGDQPDPEMPMRMGGNNVVSIFSARCQRCHGAEKQKGGLQILPLDQLFIGSDEYWVVRRGDPENSELFRRVTLMSSHEDVMPPEGEPLTKAEVKVIEDWIRAGAPTDVQQGDRPKKIRPRQWFQVYNQLDLTEQQRATSTELSMTFQRTMRQFDRDHKTQLEGYKQIVDGKTNATEAEIEEARRAMQQVNKGRPKVEPVQAELWSLLDSTQQDEFRALLVTLAQEGRRDMPVRGQEGRPGRRGDRDGGQLTPEERRRLRERRERRQNQGTEPDRDGD